MKADQPLSARAGTALLRVASHPDADHGATFAALSEDDWRGLLDAAIEARLTPLFARAIARAGEGGQAPEDVSGSIAEEYRWHELNTLRQQAAIVRLATTLGTLGFSAIALKGVGLAYRCYPDPVLRPMRDIDVLLPAEQAEPAQAALVASGDYTVHPELHGTRRSSPEHLLPLQDAVLRVTVEVHHRIGTWPGAVVLGEALAKRAAVHRIAGTEVMLPSAETNLLHLVSGAAIKDRLAISAMVLADLHYLAARGLDWDKVWELAAQARLRHALALLAGVAQQFGAQWLPPLLTGPVDRAQAHVDAAAAALLRPEAFASRRKIVDRVARAGGIEGAGRGALSLALSPEPMQLARIVGVAPTSSLRWAGYPFWLMHRAFTYARASAEARRQDKDGSEEMRAWLEQG